MDTSDGAELELVDGRWSEAPGEEGEGYLLRDGSGKEEPYVHARRRDKEEHVGKIGVWKTLGHLYIAFVGAGILGLPFAFMKSGIVFGTLMMASVAFLSYCCMLLLIQCKKIVSNEEVKTYSDLAEFVLGKQGRYVVDALLVMSQAGFCIAYVIFIIENFYISFGWSKDILLVAMLPFLCLLSLVRSLKSLAPFSMVADMASLLGILFVLLGDVENFGKDAPVHALTSIRTLPFLFGVAIYCFEGVGMILPIEASVKNRESFPKVLGIGIFSITSVYIIYGLFGYCAYGAETQEIITLNLPENWLSKVVRVCMCVGLYFTFPLMLVPVFEVTDRLFLSSAWFMKSISPSKRRFFMDASRVAIVLFIGLLGKLVPGFGSFISLLGSLCCTLLAFIIPAMIHLKLLARKATFFVRAFDIFLVIVGFTGAILGTTDALRHMTGVQKG